MTSTEYRCSACKCIFTRDSTKAWIKSYCGDTGKDARLIRVDKLKQTPCLSENIFIVTSTRRIYQANYELPWGTDFLDSPQKLLNFDGGLVLITGTALAKSNCAVIIETARNRGYKVFMEI